MGPGKIARHQHRMRLLGTRRKLLKLLHSRAAGVKGAVSADLDEGPKTSLSYLMQRGCSTLLQTMMRYQQARIGVISDRCAGSHPIGRHFSLS